MGAACRRRCHQRRPSAGARTLPAAQTSCALFMMWHSAGGGHPERDGHTALAADPCPLPLRPNSIWHGSVGFIGLLALRLSRACCVLRQRETASSCKQVGPGTS